MTTKTKKTTKKKTTKNDDILVNVENLKMHFPVTSGVIMQRTVGQVKAVDNVRRMTSASKEQLQRMFNQINNY